jgi:hypothetical protein
MNCRAEEEEEKEDIILKDINRSYGSKLRQAVKRMHSTNNGLRF